MKTSSSSFRKSYTFIPHIYLAIIGTLLLGLWSAISIPHALIATFGQKATGQVMGLTHVPNPERSSLKESIAVKYQPSPNTAEKTVTILVTDAKDYHVGESVIVSRFGPTNVIDHGAKSWIWPTCFLALFLIFLFQWISLRHTWRDPWENKSRPRTKTDR